jgi:hypothetical protein
MPLEWRLQVLGARLKERVECDVRIDEADLYTLDGADRGAAIDAMATGMEPPFVIVAGRVVCEGDFDVDLIVQALAER